jgi:hypothetical protein
MKKKKIENGHFAFQNVLPFFTERNSAGQGAAVQIY